MSWIKGRMSLAIVRASSACMRGFGRTASREKLQMREKTVGFFDGAALGRLLRNTADEGIRAWGPQSGGGPGWGVRRMQVSAVGSTSIIMSKKSMYISTSPLGIFEPKVFASFLYKGYSSSCLCMYILRWCAFPSRFCVYPFWSLKLVEQFREHSCCIQCVSMINWKEPEAHEVVEA